MTALPIAGSKWVESIRGKIYVVTGFQLIDDAVFISYRLDSDKRSDHWLGAEAFLERFTEMKAAELS